MCLSADFALRRDATVFLKLQLQRPLRSAERDFLRLWFHCTLWASIAPISGPAPV